MLTPEVMTSGVYFLSLFSSYLENAII